MTGLWRKVMSGTGMLPADVQRWKTARTLADLGELTAQWLEGAIASQPGYAPGCGPDPETASLVPVLAALNRAGYLTNCSQPGECGPGYDGKHWEQRAAVDGYTDAATASRITAIAERAGLAVIVATPAARPPGRVSYSAAAVVTRRDGKPYTWFGASASRRFLRSNLTGYGACHRDAVNTVCASWQVTVIDPEWGRPDALWEALATITPAPAA